jgi:hypothetical protein
MPNNILFVAANMYVLRNWIATGLADKCQSEIGFNAVFTSHFTDCYYCSPKGNKFPNYFYPTSKNLNYDLPKGFSKILLAIYYLRLRTFALEIKNGSAQMMMFSKRRDIIHYICLLLKFIFPRGTIFRLFLRSIIEKVNPCNKFCANLLKTIKPKCVIVGSPGFQFLDQLIIIEAKRQKVPVHCIVNSWDNMTSRGPMIRRPDTLMVWNEYMKDQALSIHQYPAKNTHIVGSLQFSHYEFDITAEERSTMYKRLRIPIMSRYLLYFTGQHVPDYEAEDIGVLLKTLEKTRFFDLPLVVRIHPQADNKPFVKLKHNKLILDCPPKFQDKGGNGLCFDLKEIRFMAALLKHSEIVFSSWGTTALLEAAIFDRPIIQLRWMNAFQRKSSEQALKVFDFQKYIHLIPFDETKCRIFSDEPCTIENDIKTIFEDNSTFSLNRKIAVKKLTKLPLRNTGSRIIKIISSRNENMRK